MTLSTTTAPDTILARMPAISDPLRCRMLILLERQELSVSELCAIVQLPQSTVSRHLKVLSTDGWIIARKNGTSRLYSALGSHSQAAESLWMLVREEFQSTALVAEDLRRLEAVVASRASGSRSFFSSAADRWSDMRLDLFGNRFDLTALLGLLEPDLVVGDLGAGTGQVVAALAPHVQRVIAVDESPQMLEAASGRLSGLPNVELRHGQLEDLPIEDSSLDAALLFLVLHHVADPPKIFREARRVLKKAGRLLILDMLPHGREEYRDEMGHVWLGFDEPQIAEWYRGSGFDSVRFIPLRPEPEMLGPSLFTTVATASSNGAGADSTRSERTSSTEPVVGK